MEARTSASEMASKGLEGPGGTSDGVRTLPLFGIPVAVTDYTQVLGSIREWLSSEHDRSLTMDAANTMSLAQSCIDPRTRSSMLAYDLILPDSVPVVWSLNRKGAGMAEVVSGPYLTPKVLATLPRRTKIALIGGYPAEHRAIVDYCRERFPFAEFVLLEEIPLTDIDQALVARNIERIEASEAELVFVLLGVPRQYYWVALAKPNLGGRVCLSVGGAFNFLIGKNHYAPRFLRRAGLWWLYRAVRDPRRLVPRYVKYNSLFVWFLLTRELLPAGLRAGRRMSARSRPGAGRRRSS